MWDARGMWPIRGARRAEVWERESVAHVPVKGRGGPWGGFPRGLPKESREECAPAARPDIAGFLRRQNAKKPTPGGAGFFVKKCAAVSYSPARPPSQYHRR